MRRLFFLFLSSLVLLSVWFFVTHTPFPSETARDAIGEYTELGPADVDVSYYKSGIGPQVILIPSAGREASDFNELVKTLNEYGYATIAIEASGIANTTLLKESRWSHIKGNHLSGHETLIRRVMDQENSDSNYAIIGHAFGNRISRSVANSRYNETNAVILLAAGGQVPIESKTEQSLRDIFNPLKSHKARMKDVEYAFFAEGNDIPDHWTRGWHTKTAQAQIKAVMASQGDDSWHCAGEVPMLIVQPMQDRIAPIENAYALRDKCQQDIEIIEVQNAGHALLPEQPEAVAEAMLAFLAKHHPTDQALKSE